MDGHHFANLSRFQEDLSDLALQAHEEGYHAVSMEVAGFRNRIELLNNDMQMYFHDQEKILRKITGE